MKIKAEKIETLPPGSRIHAIGRDWVRLADRPELHVTEYICDPQSGNIYHWASLFLSQDEVELVEA